MSSKIVNQIRSHYRAWDRGKGSTAEKFLELMADDGSFRSIGAGAQPMLFTSDHSTKDRIREYFKGLEQDWKMIFYNVRTFLVQGNTVAVVCECAWKQKHTGKVVHTPKLDILRLKKGKITDFFEYFDNHQAYAACSPEGVCTVPQKPKPFYTSGKSQTATGVTAAAANNVKTLKKLYAQWEKSKGGSADAIVATLAPNVLWGSLSAGADPVAFTKTHKGREEVRDYFRGLVEGFQMNYYKVKEYVAGGPYVLVLADISFTNKKTGKSFVSPKADLWRFNRGKATEFHEYYDTAAVMASTA
ncbi:nuclear transport factor 2 family protein [Taklimakanibacter deserti]|uniref:nuclear transport factor 2 family protein n=1 Tax=Taklimakanibacter deserti TaxID=2267839 RepID=UPI0013C44EF2